MSSNIFAANVYYAGNVIVSQTLNVATINVTTVGAITSTAAATFSATPAAAANVLTVIGSSTTGNVFQFSNSAGGNFVMTNAGRIGIGTTNPVQALEVSGSAVVAGTLSAGNPLMFRNRIINGNFDVWQRGTSFSSPATAAYMADRWKIEFDGTAATRTISRQTFATGQTSVPGNPKYFLQMAQTVAGSGGTYFNPIVQAIESVLTFAGQVVTVSFWAQATVGTPTITVVVGQIFGTVGSPSSTVYTNTPTYTLSANWQQYTWTVAVPSISGKTLGTNGDDYLGIFIRTQPNLVHTVNFASVQVEKGSVATPFEVRPFATELALCQRYYYQITALTNSGGSQSNINWGIAYVRSAGNASIYYSLPVPMRTQPTFFNNATLQFDWNAVANLGVFNSPVLVTNKSNNKDIEIDGTVTGGTQGQAGAIILASPTAGQYVSFNAEL
jgi:hypothetical protein